MCGETEEDLALPQLSPDFIFCAQFFLILPFELFSGLVHSSVGKEYTSTVFGWCFVLCRGRYTHTMKIRVFIRIYQFGDRILPHSIGIRAYNVRLKNVHIG